jgi:cob(I)alamin adenosyltransferase
LGDKLPLSEHKKAANKTFDLLNKELNSNKWDVIVADEIVGAASSGLLPINKVVRLIKNRPEGVDLVLTGHHAPKKLIDLSDLVTEMKPIKHPYKKGILAKKGIDF